MYPLTLVLTLPFSKIQPTVQEHEELFWLVGNLKLEMTEYSREIYAPRGIAYPGDDDDGGGDSEGTPSYQPRKRRFR